MGEKGRERIHLREFLGGAGLKLAGGRDQFLQIFDAGLGLLALFLLIMRDQAALPDDPVDLLIQRGRRLGLAHLPDQGHKPRERLQRPRAQEFMRDNMRRRPPQRALVAPGLVAQLRQCALADAARRGIHDPLKRGVIIRKPGQAHIGQRVLDLGALIKAHAAINAVGDAGLHQALLKQPRLRADAV